MTSQCTLFLRLGGVNLLTLVLLVMLLGESKIAKELRVDALH